MGAGVSIDEAFSKQVAEGDVAQNYMGTCDIKCSNMIKNVVVDVENSTVGGGIIFDQSCTLDEKCLFDVTQNSVVDVQLASTQILNAGNAGGWLAGLFNYDKTASYNYQDARASINNQVRENCGAATYNDINNIAVYVRDSDIKGPIAFTQKGEALGECLMKAVMNASASASANNHQEGVTGKKADKKKGTTSGLIEMLVLGVVAIIVIIIILVIIYSVWKSNKKKKTTPAPLLTVPDTSDMSMSDLGSLSLLL